jgi:VWA domain containing CoxE-like protein
MVGQSAIGQPDRETSAKKAFDGVNKMTLPTQLSPRVAALLEKTRRNRGRLIFALDATASREGMWDMASQLQAAMFEEAAKIGGLDVQLVYYRGTDEVRCSSWFSDAGELVSRMSMIGCMAGTTKIGRVLQHIRTENAREKISAVIFVGDAMEEKPQELYDAAVGLPPVFMFQEGDGLALYVDMRGEYVVDHPPLKVETVFREIAKLTNGAWARFDAGAAAKLGELLQAVAAFAVGGVKALADLRTESARKLLGQMK